MKPRKILFANVPIDGHFNPLTALAVHLKNEGHDVRWYAGKSFEKKLQKMGIIHYPFGKAKEINQFNIDEFYPERARMKPGVPKLKFDIKYFFVFRAPEYFEDIREIHKSFPFEMLVCDSSFTAAPIVKHKLKVPVTSVGIFPLTATSKDLAPYGMGLAPKKRFTGRTRQRFLRFVAKNVLFKESLAEYNKILADYDMAPYKQFLFDIGIDEADVFLQSGVPGFEYQRSDMDPKIRFVGSLRNHKGLHQVKEDMPWLSKLEGKKVILVSQGTFEPDHSKLINPTLEALKDSGHIILVATGYHHTESLRVKYPQENIIIEDFMDFDAVMPKADVYVTNGGYGGTLLSIEHALPMVSAGVNEGKNEICTRIGYFNVGVDLKTENPTALMIKEAVNRVLNDSSYKRNVEQLRDEFGSYNTMELCSKYISEGLKNQSD